MRDRAAIVVGLLVFLFLVTFPVWWNLAAGPASAPPKLPLPAGEKECVAPAATMRASHMDLLMTWRDQYVRQSDRTFVGPGGRTFARSLTKTCLKCHSNKEEFCDACHNYAAVKPYCWDCHVAPPKEARG